MADARSNEWPAGAMLQNKMKVYIVSAAASHSLPPTELVYHFEEKGKARNATPTETSEKIRKKLS